MSRRIYHRHKVSNFIDNVSKSKQLNSSNSTRTWTEWKKHYQSLLEQDTYEYEHKFIDNVLPYISGINPSDVLYQYHFKGHDGKNRYIDFLILNEHKGYCLAIELDGYGKMVGDFSGKTRDYEKFEDFLIRQNDLLKQFKMLLRYSNNTHTNKTNYVINEINEVLKNQKYKHEMDLENSASNDDKFHELESILYERESEINYLNNVVSNKENEIYSLKKELNSKPEINIDIPTSLDSDDLITYLKTENARLKWVEMKYKELQEHSSNQVSNINTINQVSSVREINNRKHQLNERKRSNNSEHTGCAKLLLISVGIFIILFIITILRG